MSFEGPLPDQWDDVRASTLSEPERLLYRSNLLGSDLRITNPLSEDLSVLRLDPLAILRSR